MHVLMSAFDNPIRRRLYLDFVSDPSTPARMILRKFANRAGLRANSPIFAFLLSLNTIGAMSFTCALIGGANVGVLLERNSSQHHQILK
jgi:hypothetical protein